MPNHVTTIVRANRDVIHDLLTEDGVDFNRVIPMPDNVIQGGIGSATIDGVYQKVYYPEPIIGEDGKPTKSEPVPYPVGGIDWYEWSIQNWGTKWNAYSDEVLEEDRIVKFDTAWSHPYPVIEALSKKHPDHVIEVAYADEDLGFNLGVYRALNGEYWEYDIPAEGSDAATDLACIIKYGRRYADMESDDVITIEPGQILTQFVAGELT